MSSVRRLAAILAADVAGYSRLMGADEEGTHDRLKIHFGELVNPKIAEHRGRVVKNTGDGFLAEFGSVVDAVRCATEIQRGMVDREPEVPEERRIRFCKKKDCPWPGEKPGRGCLPLIAHALRVATAYRHAGAGQDREGMAMVAVHRRSAERLPGSRACAGARGRARCGRGFAPRFSV